MVLTTHGLVGGAIAALLPGAPALAVPAALASHYLLDALPHWDYPMPSLENPGASRSRDVLKVIADGLSGLVLPLIIFGDFAFWPLVLVAAAVAMFPDFLQFVYYVTRLPALAPTQNFHEWIHTPYKFKRRPLLGISLQLVFILAVIALVYYI